VAIARPVFASSKRAGLFAESRAGIKESDLTCEGREIPLLRTFAGDRTHRAKPPLDSELPNRAANLFCGPICLSKSGLPHLALVPWEGTVPTKPSDSQVLSFQSRARGSRCWKWRLLKTVRQLSLRKGWIRADEGGAKCRGEFDNPAWSGAAALQPSLLIS
jgi:hypothetical protein